MTVDVVVEGSPDGHVANTDDAVTVVPAVRLRRPFLGLPNPFSVTRTPVYDP